MTQQGQVFALKRSDAMARRSGRIATASRAVTRDVFSEADSSPSKTQQPLLTGSSIAFGGRGGFREACRSRSWLMRISPNTMCSP
jgi:hypothetical protein